VKKRNWYLYNLLVLLVLVIFLFLLLFLLFVLGLDFRLGCPGGSCTRGGFDLRATDTSKKKNERVLTCWKGYEGGTVPFARPIPVPLRLQF
jgi:hypothetical protein